MKYSIILAALMGLMTSEEVHAIQKHSHTLHRGDENCAPKTGGAAAPSPSTPKAKRPAAASPAAAPASDSGSESSGSDSESESSSEPQAQAAGGQQQQAAGGQQTQAAGGQQQQAAGGQQQQAAGGQQTQAAGGQQQQAAGGQQQQAAGGQQQQAAGGQQQQAAGGQTQAAGGQTQAAGGQTQAAGGQQQESGSDSGSDSESEGDDQHVQTGDYFFARDIGRGTLDAKYQRIPPARFSADSDDLFMRSMIMKYAAEEKTGDGLPSGAFFMNEASARRAATEIVGSHAGLKGDDLKAYIETYFPRTWAHFDVNGTGMIGVEVMPQLARFIASDQTLQLS